MNYTSSYQNYEANILGCLLEDAHLIERIQLDPEDFEDPRHQVIIRAMLRMKEKQVPIGVLEVFEYLQKHDLLSAAGEWDYVSNLKQLATSPANIEYEIASIKEQAYMRRIKDTADKLIKAKSIEEVRRLQTKLSEEEIQHSESRIISLSEYHPQPRSWFIDNRARDKSIVLFYGEGGVLKSYLALHFGILTARGEEKFLELKFPQDPRNVLYCDWELDLDEFSSRALMIARGLGLEKAPSNLHYYSPEKSLYKLLPELKAIISAKKIQLLIIDSLGASCVDPDKVTDIVEVFNQIRNLGITTLILDHQSKMQAQDNYHIKTPYGSVYKYNLSRSVFQLSCIARKENRISLMLRHKKNNFGPLLEDLVFDASFECDRVMFLQSNELTPEEHDLRLIHNAITELEAKLFKVNQKAIIQGLRGMIGKDKLLSLLEKGAGAYWDVTNGERNEKVYKSRILEYIAQNCQNSRIVNGNGHLEEEVSHSEACDCSRCCLEAEDLDG